MKDILAYIAALAVALLLIPLPAFQSSGQAVSRPSEEVLTPSDQTTGEEKSHTDASSSTVTSETKTGSRSAMSSAASAAGDVFRVQLDSGVREMEAKAFLTAVVACEMPLSYREEALKAQTVASYTYFSRRREEARRKGLAADFSDVPSRFEEFSTEEGLEKALGKYYETYRATLTRVIDAVYGYVLCYKDEKILSTYHAINAGVTDSGTDVWNTDYPYLQSVPSPGDTTAEGYRTQVIKSEAETKACLQTLLKKAPTGQPETWVTVTGRLESGTVTSVNVCGETVTGAAFRKALGLRSANFEMVRKDGQFVFTVKGYGHGVGMSQFGANYLAGQGADWQEILRHYYTGITIEKTAT